MAVGAQQSAPWDSKTFHVNRVANTVARAALPDAELPAGAQKKQVIIGIFEIGLQQIVIHILREKLGFNPRDLHGLKFQHHHCAGSILCQGLIDSKANFFSRLHAPIHQMGFNQFLGDILSHLDFFQQIRQKELHLTYGSGNLFLIYPNGLKPELIWKWYCIPVSISDPFAPFLLFPHLKHLHRF
jgi:hypothetical protein